VLRHGWQRNVEGRRELGHRRLTFGEAHDDGTARRISQRGENGIERVEGR
jgi:hypothetical protein